MVFSRSHDRVALVFMILGLVAAVWILTKGMILASVVQGLGSIMGGMALLVFGGEISEK